MIKVHLGGRDGKKKSSTTRIAEDLRKILPKQFLTQVSSTRAKKSVFYVIAAAIALLPHLFYSQYQSFVEGQHKKRVTELQEKLQTVEEEMRRLASYKRELESYDAQKKLVRERLDSIRNLLGRRNGPINILDAIGQSLPKRTWLATLDFKLGDDGKASLDLAGSAYGNEDISDYIDSLQKSIFVSDVSLKGVNQATSMAEDFRTFTMAVKGKEIIGTPVQKTPTPNQPPVRVAPRDPTKAEP